jgi:solute carrier family 25 protein 38
MFSTLQKIVQEESIAGLWRGTVPTILRNVPGSGLYFYTLHLIRTNMSRITWNNSPLFSPNLVHLTGGVLARVSVGYLMMPITVVKVRYESSIYAYRSISDAFYSILKKVTLCNEGRGTRFFCWIRCYCPTRCAFCWGVCVFL